MPYVIKHKTTNEIYSCELVNIYDIAYHGAKAWEDDEEAREQYEQFLEVRGEAVDEWELLEVDENQMKLLNVKLNNNPSRAVYWEDGRPVARTLGH
jgi:hypothetical protein